MDTTGQAPRKFRADFDACLRRHDPELPSGRRPKHPPPARTLLADRSASPRDRPQGVGDHVSSQQILRRQGHATAEQAADLRRALATCLHENDVLPELTGDILLAVYEAVANVVDHAYAPHTGDVELRAYVGPDSLTVTVSDHGRWQIPHHDPLRGRGLKIMHELADSTSVRSDAHGTTVTLSWHNAQSNGVGETG